MKLRLSIPDLFIDEKADAKIVNNFEKAEVLFEYFFKKKFSVCFMEFKMYLLRSQTELGCLVKKKYQT